MHTLDQLRAGALRGITRLDLSAGLTELPAEVLTLADTLEVLNLSGNALTHLPDWLPRLHRLRVIFCSDNPFTELPPVLGRCAALEVIGFKACRIQHVAPEALPPRLRWLILTDNRLAALPDAVGRCSRLHKLMLAGNRLRQLPASLAECRELELLRLSANQFEDLPPLLTTLPNLRWLALAGNPFSDRVEQASNSSLAAAAEAADAAVGAIDWQHLQLDAQLGEGASGVIHQARWQPPGASASSVALKLFKGAMTSDGLPRSEMAACLAAGRHPGLIPVLGRLQGHPQGTEGLALELIEPSWRTLADPPSLHSCTRDVYADDLQLSGAQALRLASDIAAAAAHLHERGILHGDLYAHNILWQPDSGAALLGDFGAASQHGRADPAQGRALQALEVAALGCLLGELAQRVKPDGAAAHSASTCLRALAEACQHPSPGQRPSMACAAQQLDRLRQG